MKPLPQICVLGLFASVILAASALASDGGTGIRSERKGDPKWLGRIDGLVSPELASRLSFGPLPATEAFFGELQRLGIRTVVSVDGKRPNLEAAKRHGLTYIHVPLNYDTVTSEQRLALGSILKRVEGKIYFHCHHGHHRAPVALAIACLGNGYLNVGQAKSILVRAGTSPDYVGLWKAVESTSVISDWSRAPALVSNAKVSTITESMTKIEEVYANLEGKDVSAESQADGLLLLKEQYKELARQRSWPKAFAKRIAESIRLVDGIRSECENTDSFEKDLRQIRNDCRSCHKSFRDGGQLDRLLSSSK